MKRLLHLQHHHHSGRVLPHKHTSYRGLLVLVALFGVALFALHQSVRADDIVVTAKVAAAAPSTQAVVTSHQDGDSVSTSSITIAGTCSYIPPATVVEIHIDNQFVGSTACTSGGTFSTTITVAPGTHAILLRTVNISDDYGPDSTPIYITYSPAPPPTPGTSTPPSTNDGSLPPQSGAGELLIHSKSTYLLYGPEKDAEWIGYFQGGTLPYQVKIDWGDGTSSSFTDVDTSQQTYRHTYSTFESFFVTITVTDSAGYTLSTQIAAVTPYIGTTTPTFIVGEELARVDQLILYVGYGTVAVLVLLGILTIFHAEYPYLGPRPVAKQYVRTRSHPRRRR